MFTLQCESKTTSDNNSYDEVDITNIKLAKINKDVVNNINVKSTHLLNQPLNGPGV